MAGLEPFKKKISCHNCGLQRICFPSGLSRSEIDRLDQIVDTHPVLKKGSYLFRQGEAAQQLYALKSGMVKLVRTDEQGNERIHAFYLPGDVIGLEMLDMPCWSYDAVVIDDCALCVIEQERLAQLAEQLPNLNRQVLHMMGRELRLEREHFETMTYRSAEDKLAAFMISISRRYRERGYDHLHFRLAILHRDLASYLALSPETISRVLRRFQQAGILTWRRKYVEIHSPEKLYALVETCMHPGCPTARPSRCVSGAG